MIKDEKITSLKKGEWVSIGEGSYKIPAVVCNIYSEPEIINITGEVDVVYLDDQDRAINEGVVWKNDHWEFKHSGPNGGYADKNERLAEFVSILRKNI